MNKVDGKTEGLNEGHDLDKIQTFLNVTNIRSNIFSENSFSRNSLLGYSKASSSS